MVPIHPKAAMLFAAERESGRDSRGRTSANAPPSRRIPSGTQKFTLSLALSGRVLVSARSASAPAARAPTCFIQAHVLLSKSDIRYDLRRFSFGDDKNLSANQLARLNAAFLPNIANVIAIIRSIAVVIKKSPPKP